MKKRKEVGIKDIISDNTAWADLILSKTALILATVIILAAVYGLAGSYADMIKKDELEIIATDLTKKIDSAGMTAPRKNDAVRSYDLDTYRSTCQGQSTSPGKLIISVSGEYVVCSFEENEQIISAARSLSYRTLACDPSELHYSLTTAFGADGNISQPVHSVFPYADVTEFLAVKGTQESYFNTSEKLRIRKTSVFVTDGSEVNELEYILVYQ